MAASRGFRPFQIWPSVLLVLLAAQSCSGLMAAWYTTMGPQLMRQNETSGEIMYSMCNSNDTPVFPIKPNVFTLEHTPRNGTSMGARGWWDETTTYASIFYQSKDGDIVNSFQQCNMNTGKFFRRSDVIISTGVPTPHDETGLAVVNMGAKDGYRVFYHDTQKQLHAIAYRPSDNAWYYYGLVSKDVPLGMAIGAAERENKGNITVIYPRDGENIGVSRLNEIKKWMLSSTPRPLIGNFTANTNTTNTTDIKLNMTSDLNYTLAAWTGNPGTLAISIDKVFTRNMFYIGSDRALYQIANKNYVWQTTGLNLTRNIWPLADKANGDFAMAWHLASSRIRIYYDVNGNLTELRQESNGFWEDARPVMTFNASAVVSPSSSATITATTTATASSDSTALAAAPSSELSTGAKAGIGVGVAFGVIAIGAAIFGVFLMKRRQAAAAAEEEEAREEEKHRHAAIAAATNGGGGVGNGAGGHHQGYYYPNSGPASSDGQYPGPYGSPPPPLTPFSENGSNGSHWPAEKTFVPPQELHNMSAAYELPEERQAHEMEAWRAQQEQQEQVQVQGQQLQPEQQQQQIYRPYQPPPQQ